MKDYSYRIKYSDEDKARIAELRSEGWNLKKLAEEYNCSITTIFRILNPHIKYKHKRTELKPEQIRRHNIQHKINHFIQKDKHNKFTVEDLYTKFGQYTQCYITGTYIDLSKPETYHFDHIIPKSKGGINHIDNLGICIPQANLAKSALDYESFVQFCRAIVNYYDYKLSCNMI